MKSFTPESYECCGCQDFNGVSRTVTVDVNPSFIFWDNTGFRTLVSQQCK